MTLPLLTLLVAVPAAGALVVALVPGMSARGRRGATLVVQALVVLLTVLILQRFDVGAAGMQLGERHPWVPSLGIEYRLGVDGLGLVGVILAAAVPLFALLAARDPGAERARLYYPLVLLLQAGLMGTFTALNFFHWFLFWELGLVPAYLLVRMFGAAGAGRASFQFFVYTMVGSVALLLGFLALRAAGGSFDFEELAALGRSGRLAESLAAQLPWAGLFGSGATLAWLVFGGVMLGLAVKVPLWPFHTWLPDTYAEAPTPVTMMLTGVMSKMGVYGMARIAWPIFPDQFRDAQGVLVGLALATIVFPVLAAFAERDLKRVLAYSSINHLGYCLLGLFVLTPGQAGPGWINGAAGPALNGVILQMLNHGLTAAALFAGVGVIERRAEGRRGLDEFGGLRQVAPVFCGLMGLSVFASVGLPGLNGFVSEFLIFRGVFAVSPGAAAVATLGLLGTGIFLLTVMHRVFHGPLDPTWAKFPDLTTGERWLLGVPVGLMLLLGLWPDLVLRLTNPTVVGWLAGS